jgi:hypothetical protein
VSDDVTPAAEPEPAEAQPARRGAHPVLVYTLQRVLVLIGTAAVLYLLGLRDPMWLLLFAFLISGIVSIFVLDRSREAAAGGVVGAVQKVNSRIEASASKEDDLVDGAAGGAPSPAPSKPGIPADDDLDEFAPHDDKP